MSELSAILRELQEIKAELQRGRINSEYYTTEEAIAVVYRDKPVAGAAILRELKKRGKLTNHGRGRWSKREIDRIAHEINRTLFFDVNYKLIKNKKAA